LRLRGQPAGARTRLFEMIVYPGLAPNTPTRGPSAPTGLAMACRDNATTVSWDNPSNKKGSRLYNRTEVYISTTEDFTPSSDNFWGDTSGSSMEVTGLPSSTKHFCRIRHRGRAQAGVENVSPYS